MPIIPKLCNILRHIINIISNAGRTKLRFSESYYDRTLYRVEHTMQTTELKPKARTMLLKNFEIDFPGKASQTFPPEIQQFYYDTHYAHVKNYLTFLGNVNVNDSDTTLQENIHNNNFVITINDKPVLFDYSDFDYHILKIDHLETGITYFKLHTNKTTNHRCLPFPPMSFMNWSDYNDLKNNISYDPYGSIFYKCRIYGGAVERRGKVKDILENYKNIPVDFSFVEQLEYFKTFNNCRINVIVPGARNDILDRTHLQSFAFGIPVITPKISTLLPFNKMFEPNIDYIECSPDYSDVIHLIEKHKNNKSYLDFISQNCKNKFQYTCSPEAVESWILTNV